MWNHGLYQCIGNYEGRPTTQLLAAAAGELDEQHKSPNYGTGVPASRVCVKARGLEMKRVALGAPAGRHLGISSLKRGRAASGHRRRGERMWSILHNRTRGFAHNAGVLSIHRACGGCNRDEIQSWHLQVWGGEPAKNEA